MVQNILRSVLATPALQGIRARMEKGGVLSLAGVHPAAQPFFAFVLQELFPERPIVVVTEGVKAQESFQQDLETWSSLTTKSDNSAKGRPLFYPSWEILPHESRLPHADVISERLQTLVALTKNSRAVPLVVTNVAALMQRTFPAEVLAEITRVFKRGERIEPLDLIE